jgi:hypothetical protein
MYFAIKLRDFIDMDSDTIMTDATDINLVGDNMLAFSKDGFIQLMIPIASILFVQKVDDDEGNFKQLSFDSLGKWLN